MDFACACGNRGNLRVPLAAQNFYFLAPPHDPLRRSENRCRFAKRLRRACGNRGNLRVPLAARKFLFFWPLRPTLLS